MPKYTKNGCPACGCKNYLVFGTIQHPPHLSEFNIPEGSVIVRCRECRLIYVDPMPHWDSEDFAKLYDITYFSNMEDEKQKKWMDIRENINPQKRFASCSRYIKSNKNKMLEIGAGEYGFMCRFLASVGWDVTAQEPGLGFKDSLTSKGIRVETKGVMDLDGDGEFSFIFADSVLEHVPNPVEYFAKLKNLLAPGGVFYTISPNEYSMYNFLFNLIAKRKGNTPHYIAPYESPYHLLGFTKKSYQILAEKCGLHLISYRKIDDYQAFHVLNTNHSALIKYPFALLLVISQSIGLGTNGEAMFIKN